MKTQANATLSKGAQTYINSLIQQDKIFTVNTVKNQFPNESTTTIATYVAKAAKGKRYVTVANGPVYVPSSMFAKNASTVTTVKVSARKSVMSGKIMMNVPLSSSIVNQLRLSARSYRYSIRNRTITISRSSTSLRSKLSSFTVWANNRAAIPVDTLGEYTIRVR